MIDATAVVAAAEVQGESRCNGAPLVRFSQEDPLLKRLEEVERFGANIANELRKARPCQGALSRELLELELDELKLDRDALQNKLTLLLKAPNNGCSSSYEGPTENTLRSITLRPSSPARAERQHQENQETTFSGQGVSVTINPTNLSRDRKMFTADSEALVDSRGGSTRAIAQQQPSATPGHLDGSSNNSSKSSSSSTTHGRAATASCGRDLDAGISDSFSSAALDLPGSNTTHGKGATASNGRDLDTRVNDSMSSAAPDQSGTSTMHGSITITAGNGGRDLNEKINENLSGRNRLEKATAGRPTDDDHEYALDARMVVVVDKSRRLYNAAPAPPSRFDYARGRAGYDAGVGVGAGGGGGGGGGRNAPGVPRSVAVVEPGGVGGSGGTGGGGFRVSRWQCRPTSNFSAQRTVRSDTSQQRWTSAPFAPDTGIITTGIVAGRCDSNVNINSTPTRMPLKRPCSLGEQDFHQPKRFSTEVRTLNFCEGGVNHACAEQGFHEPKGLSNGVRTLNFSEGGVGRGWQRERRDGDGGWRVKKGSFRAPVAPFSGLDTPSGVFNEDYYLASPVSYPPPRPSHHRGYRHGEQRDYDDAQSNTQNETKNETQRETQRETQSLRRDMGREEPFSKRKTFRISEEQGEERDMNREEPFSMRSTFRVSQEKGEEEPFSKSRWTDAPAQAHWSGSGGIDNGNGACGNPREFTTHTVPVALAVDVPSERMAGDGQLYYEYNRQGHAIEGRRPQGEMSRNSFFSNTDQLLAERGGRRYDLGPTVTPPPYR